MFRFFWLIFVVNFRYDGILAQHHTPYSLQSAVDALHRREAQLALKDNLNIPPRYAAPTETEYWDDDSEIPTDPNRIGRHRLNKILERYLAHEDNLDREGYGGGGFENDFDDGNYIPEESKRSFFRERDEKYDPPQLPTAFREREIQPELAEQFLREIEEARELDREEKYNEALRRLWDKYQQQENEIEGDLFEERKHSPMEPNNYYVGPLMQKKRTYPVLPWLPMSRRKRFPVAKRSANPKSDGTDKPETDDKVAKDLQELFGKSGTDKKKRSTDAQNSSVTENPKDLSEHEHSDHADHQDHDHSDHADHQDHDHEHDNDHNHDHKHIHKKRSDDTHESKESDEHHEHDEEESEEHDDHGEDDEEDEHEDFDDEDEEERKKKRDLTSKIPKKSNNLEVVHDELLAPGALTKLRMKKSIDWSKYFGINRKKKSITPENQSSDAEVKRSLTTESIENEPNLKESISPEKLENMEKKLQNIEDLIIGETIKYTGAHEGMRNPEDIRRFKDHVVSRLATAYSLEKMRRALDKLRQSVDDENHLQKNTIELEDEKEKAKRLSVKKEKVEFENAHHSINGAATDDKAKEMKMNSISESNDNNKKKRTRYQKYPDVHNEMNDFDEEMGTGHFEPLNDAYLGSKNYAANSKQCPILDSMAERCRGVDILSGDIHQELLPICGVHQICYLCGASQVACDFQYLSDADTVCGRNGDCQSAARAALMILRGAPGPQLGPKECLKNPCLYKVMRDMGL